MKHIFNRPLLYLGTLIIFLIPFVSFSEEGGEIKKCCAIGTEVKANEENPKGICCNGPNGEDGEFSDRCCTVQNGRVVENKQTGKKKCCLVKNPQQS